MQSKLYKSLILMLLQLICCACVDEIELQQGDRLDNGIALSGRMRIENGIAEVEFRAVRLFVFTSNRGETIALADVTLELSTGEVFPLEYDFMERVFRARFPFDPPPGTTVQVRVITGDGDDYLSAPEEVPAPVVPERGYFETIAGEGDAPDRIRFMVATNGRRTDGSGIPFLYRFSQHYRIRQSSGPSCFFTERLQQVNVNYVDGFASYPGPLRNIQVYADQVDFRHAEGYYLSVIQEPLSATAATYFSTYVDIINRDASIFEPPPGNLPGNFASLTDPDYDQIYGYFYVTRPTTLHIGIAPGTLDITPLCTLPNFESFSACVMECFEVGGRTIPAPFWDF